MAVAPSALHAGAHQEKRWLWAKSHTRFAYTVLCGRERQMDRKKTCESGVWRVPHLSVTPAAPCP